MRGGMAADGAVENNFYLTQEALKRDEHTARKIYSVIKEQAENECSSKGRITECRQNIGRIIEFTQDKRFDSRFKDLKKESLYYLNQHPDLVASYLKAEYEKLKTKVSCTATSHLGLKSFRAVWGLCFPVQQQAEPVPRLSA